MEHFNFKSFLEKHRIIEISSVALEPYICLETIVDNPKHFIAVVLQSKYYISMITWWDRAKIDEGSPIGYGGPRDPRDFENYYFAETDLSASFDQETTKERYLEYIEKILSSYPENDLYPAFEVSKMR